MHEVLGLISSTERERRKMEKIWERGGKEEKKKAEEMGKEQEKKKEKKVRREGKNLLYFLFSPL
jgi:hypothetical protein